MSDPDFSLIMPTFNRADIISKAIKSVLDQTYLNFELIIVDDASTDSTYEIIKEKFEKELSCLKIRYVRSEKNVGVSLCRNIGLSTAKNNWIGYIDSDNILDKDYLKTYVEYIRNYPDVKIFYAQYRKMSNNSIGLSHDYSFEALRARNYIDLGVFVHHSSVYKELGGFDESLKRLVDWDLILTYCEKYPPLFIDHVVMTYNDLERADRVTKKESMSIACTRIAKKHNLPLKQVTTLIVSYNHEKYIEEALKSVLNQDGYFISKIMISDDASSDGTSEIIKKYVNIYPDIIVDCSNKINLGISGNYRKSFEIINSDYLAILEGDDYWIDRNKISTQLNFLENNMDCSMVFSDFFLLRNDVLLNSPHYAHLHKTKMDFNDFFKYDLNPIINLSCCMFRTSFLKNIPEAAFKYRLSEITLGLLSVMDGFLGYTKKIQSVYRVIDTGTWSGLNKLGKLYSAYTVRFVASTCVSKNMSCRIRAWMYKKYLNNVEFVEYLIKKDKIDDYSKYVKTNYKFIQYYNLLNRISTRGSSLSKNISNRDLKTRINLSLSISDQTDLEATIILAYLHMNELSQSAEMYYNIFSGKHTVKDYLEIARAYKSGTGISKNLDCAIKWYDVCVSRGDKWARIELISVLMESNVDENHVRAYNLSKSIERNPSDIHRKDAMIRLARMYAEGIGTEIDLSAATNIYRKLIDQDSKELSLEYVKLLVKQPSALDCYDDFIFLEKIYSKYSFDGLTELALSRAYRRGIVVQKDLNEAETYLIKSMQNGNEWAKVELISCLMEGDEVMNKRAFENAIKFSKDVGSKHIDEIYLRLSKMYANGIGVKQNLDAANYYRTLSERVN